MQVGANNHQYIFLTLFSKVGMSMSLVRENVSNDSPAAYAAAAILAQVVGEQMLARLEWVTLQPKRIVDLGCGVGQATGLLQQRYPEAHVVGVDSAHPMLAYAKQQATSAHYLCADAQQLPFAAGSVDLLFANLLLPWCADLETCLLEWRRVLRPGGLLVFTSLGPGTFSAWRPVITDQWVPRFIDMHDVGDVLTRTRYADPVLDVENVTLTYRKLETLFDELQASNMIVLTDNERAAILAQSLTPMTPDGRWSLTYEVVFGHAWGPELTATQHADAFGVVKIPLSHLRGRGVRE